MSLSTEHTFIEPFEGLYKRLDLPQKIGQIAGDSILIVTDFDRCVSDSDTWSAVYEALDEEAKTEDRNSYKRYLKHGDNQLWWTETVENYKRSGITSREIEQKISTIIPRPGFLEFCQLIETHDIPFTIVSAGLGNVITMFKSHHNIKDGLIIANNLVVDKDDRIIGYESEEIIHDANKAPIALEDQRLRRLLRGKIPIVIGDGDNDPKVVNDRIAFRVGMDTSLDEVTRQRFVQKSFDLGYDIVTQDGSWKPILEFLKNIYA